MERLERYGPLAIVVSSAVIINLGYLASNLYKLPGVISVILIPCSMVLLIGWFQRSIKGTIALTFGIIFLSAVFLQISLSMPVITGIIEDLSYRRVFIYGIFIRVLRYAFITSFFSLLTALVAGLAFE
jgi:hypothetical protein